VGFGDQSSNQALEQMTDELAQFVTVNYFPDFARTVILAGRQLESVHVESITGVTVPIPDSDNAAGTKDVAFSFKTEVDVQTSTAQMASRYGMEPFDFPRMFMSERITLEIEANAKVENGEYKDIRFLSVRHP
jgi:hypothetical protein